MITLAPSRWQVPAAAAGLALVRILVLSALPVPDLYSRRKVRRAACQLARGCNPWPGMDASGTDVARLALLRLLYLQHATRWAVRGRQDEAATMLARVAIEAYITGNHEGLTLRHGVVLAARVQQSRSGVDVRRPVDSG
jgi:hypothetical protein